MIRTLALSIVFALAALPLHAAERAVSIELNKLDPNGGSCRAYLVLKNDAQKAFDSLKLDIVLFDRDGVVAKRLAVEAAPLPAGKTSLKVFDIAGQPCPGIGRILLNDILAWTDAEGPREDCLGVVRQGRVNDFHLQRSSGHTALDEEVVALVQRASPLPPPPPDLFGNPVKLVVPVQFLLR